MTPLKAEYIGADQLPSFIFRLQLCGGPYIPIRRLQRQIPRRGWDSHFPPARRRRSLDIKPDMWGTKTGHFHLLSTAPEWIDWWFARTESAAEWVLMPARRIGDRRSAPALSAVSFAVDVASDGQEGFAIEFCVHPNITRCLYPLGVYGLLAAHCARSRTPKESTLHLDGGSIVSYEVIHTLSTQSVSTTNQVGHPRRDALHLIERSRCIGT